MTVESPARGEQAFRADLLCNNTRTLSSVTPSWRTVHTIVQARAAGAVARPSATPPVEELLDFARGNI